MNLRTAPWWMVSLVLGVPFGLATTALGLVRGRSLGDTLVIAGVGALIFGAIMGPLIARVRVAEPDSLTETFAEEQRHALRAAARDHPRAGSRRCRARDVGPPDRPTP